MGELLGDVQLPAGSRSPARKSKEGFIVGVCTCYEPCHSGEMSPSFHPSAWTQSKLPHEKLLKFQDADGLLCCCSQQLLAGSIVLTCPFCCETTLCPIRPCKPVESPTPGRPDFQKPQALKNTHAPKKAAGTTQAQATAAATARVTRQDMTPK